MGRRFSRHYCSECGRPIIPYRYGYTKCKGCFFRTKTLRDSTPQDSISTSNRESFFGKFSGFTGKSFKYVIVIVIVIGVFYFYFGGSIGTIQNYLNNPEKIKELSQDIKQTIVPEVNGEANSGFPYWTSKTIKYRFDSNNICSSEKRNNILRAFDILHDETNGLLSYVESQDGELLIGCHDIVGSASGWAAPWIYPDGKIEKATIDFYRIPSGSVECETYPTLELHEALHTLGFEDDFSSKDNIMYYGKMGEYWNPCRMIDRKIVECLKNIYSNGKEGSSCSGIPHKFYSPDGTIAIIRS